MGVAMMIHMRWCVLSMCLEHSQLIHKSPMTLNVSLGAEYTVEIPDLFLIKQVEVFRK